MKVFAKNLLVQPIFHFLVLAGTIFLLHGWIVSDDTGTEGNQIVVDQDALLTYVQHRNRAFNEQAAKAHLAELGTAEYNRLVEDMVREEVLYREAEKMGLSSGDYVIKRRMIQKMEYLIRGFASGEDRVEKDQQEAFYLAHRERYRRPETLTFSHVFIDESNPDPERRARELLDVLQKEKASFAHAPTLGDRFVYHRNYVQRDFNFIASHFCNEFARELDKIDEPEGRWLGPIPSQHGLHLVMVTQKDTGGVPQLDLIRDRVVQDALEERRNSRSEVFIGDLVKSYEVIVPESKRTSSSVDADAF